MEFSTAQIHQHPVDGSSLIPILKPYLPYPIALYRRLQLPHRSSSSNVFATFNPGTTYNTLPRCFCVAFVDRSRRPDAEVYIFLSGQADSMKRCPPSTAEQCPDCTAALLAVVKQVAELPLPESVHKEEFRSSLDADATALTDYARHVLDPDCMLIGSLAQLPTDILLAHHLVRTDLPHAPYQKFIIRTGPLSTIDCTLPAGLRWGEVRTQDYPLVKSRTDIPRKDKTLAICPSMAIFPTTGEPNSTESVAPIAWAFVGVDGALATLHTEPEYRGKGLAKKLTAKLLTEKLRLLDEREGDQDGGWWGHSDVSPANKESQGVARGLGGKEGWFNYWIRIDLGKARAASGVRRDGWRED